MCEGASPLRLVVGFRVWAWRVNVRLLTRREAHTAQMGKSSRKTKGGNTKRLEKALERMPAAELDSSDEEMAEQLELGKQGK